jgi:hypothetical protein
MKDGRWERENPIPHQDSGCVFLFESFRFDRLFAVFGGVVFGGQEGGEVGCGGFYFDHPAFGVRVLVDEGGIVF